MPNARFYSAPIDPGWATFGAAIAQGMGQGINNMERNDYLARQERWRAEDIARQKEQQEHVEALAREQAASQALREGYQFVGPEEASAIPVAMGKTPVFIPNQKMPPVGLPGALETPAEAPPPIMGRSEIPGPVALAQRQLTEERTQKAQPKEAAKGILPAGAYYDPALRRIMRFDPAASQAAQVEAYTYKQNLQRAAEAREQIGNVIAGVLADGKIDWKTEAPILLKWGLKPADLEDPEQAHEKAFKWWEKEFAKEQAGREAVARIQASANATGQMTANQRMELAISNLQAKINFDIQRGVNANRLYNTYLGEAQRLGIGLGNLRGMITRAGVGDTSREATEAQVRDRAERALDNAGVWPEGENDPVYNRKLIQQMTIERKNIEAEQRARFNELWTPEAPAGPAGGAGGKAKYTWADIERNAATLRGLTPAQIRTKLNERPGYFTPVDIEKAARTYGIVPLRGGSVDTAMNLTNTR